MANKEIVLSGNNDEYPQARVSLVRTTRSSLSSPLYPSCELILSHGEDGTSYTRLDVIELIDILQGALAEMDAMA